MIDFGYDDSEGLLTIGERRGGFPGMLQDRVFNVIAVSAEGKGKAVPVRYSGKQMTVSL